MVVFCVEGVVGEDGGFFGGFLCNMFDVCFVELCEGDDVDVIFLCVENVVCMGCIFDVLVEIDVLLELV